MKTYHPMIPRESPSLLSLILPIYNEEEVIPLMLARLDEVLPTLGVPVEVILVNDGSSDRGVDLLLSRARRDGRFKVISLARNFGHQIASTAGLDHARGDAVVLMDADLQDPPELIADMLREYRRGYDVVYARRVERQGDGPLKRWTAWMFYRLMRGLVHRDLPADVGDFRLISRPCLDTLNSMRELHRFLRGMITWVGFPQTAVEFTRPRRAAGKTKYPLRKMVRFAWNAVVSFSPLPLRFSFATGAAITAIGFLYGIYATIRVLTGQYVVPGWTSVIVLLCLIGGGIMISLGILGEYVGRLFEEIKERPLYVVSLTANVATAPPQEKSGKAVSKTVIHIG
jgi:glycosyltransferase involved in cell wall biosynthesis